MSDSAEPSRASPPPVVPLGQRFADSPFLLLLASLLVMLVFYTGWGLFELASLTEAPLP